MPGTRTNGYRSHSRDDRPPRVASDQKKLEQKYWRKDCLLARVTAGKWTPKNAIEAERLGLTVPVDGESFDMGGIHHAGEAERSKK